MTKSTRMHLSVSASEKPVEDVLYSPVTNDGGCFTKLTTILKGNWEGMDISSVDAHTVYLGGEGVTGKVSSEPVQYTTQADKFIYGFNGEKPFFTADHPFATQHGWRAIDPVAAKKINPWLEVGPLETGDLVKRITFAVGPNGFDYKLERINNITRDTLPGGSMLYGIHTNEGPKSYHANGYLVHMNFPEISSDKLSKSMTKLFQSKSQSIVQDVIEPMITDMHGDSGQILLQNIKNSLQHKTYSQAAHIPLHEVVLLNMPLSYDDEANVGYNHPMQMSLIRGKLYLDYEYIESAVLINEHQIVWTREMDGSLQHGNVILNPDRMVGYGRISTDRLPGTMEKVSFAASSTSSPVQKAIVVHHVKFSTSLPLSVYNCKVGTTPLPAGKTVSPGAMVDWGTLIMGYERDPTTGHMKPVGKATLPPLITTPDDLGNGVIFSVNKATQALKVEVHVPSDYCAMPGGPKYIHMDGTFNWDYSSLKGTAIEYDASKSGFEGKSFEWQGQIRHSSAALTTLQQSRSASFLTQKTYSSSVTSKMAMSSNAAPVHPSAFALAHATATQDLNLEELFTLTAPPASETHSLTFDMIKQMMEHEVPDNWRSDILGVSKPDIGDLTYFAKNHSNFLANQFGVSYIGYALSKNSHFGKSYTQAEKNKLLYYWSGNNSKSLSHNKDYSNTNTVVSTHAFIKESQKLQKYMKSDPVGWAKKLFDHLTIPYVMNGFVLSLDVAQSNALLQKQCMVLQCLAPKVDYGSQLYHRVMVLQLSNMGQTYTGSTDDKEILKEFIYDSFYQMVTRILNGDDGLDSKISAQLQQLIRDSKKEVNAATTVDYMTSMQTMITQIVSMWGKGSGVVMQKMSSALEQFAKNNPKLTFTGKVIGCLSSMAMYGFLAYTIVKQFMNWKALSPEQKVLVVANTVSFIFATIAKIPSMINKLQEIKTGFFDFEFVKTWHANRNSKDTQIAEDENMNSLVEDVENISPSEVSVRESEQAVSNGGTAEAEATTNSNFEKFFNVAQTVAKVFNIIALSAAVVALGFQIARDFKENQSVSVKALDISQAAIIGLQIAVEVTAMVFEDAVLATIGSALALAGIIIAIIILVIGRKPPAPKPTAGDTFIADNSKPFLKTLPEPTQKWLDEYHGRHPSS